MNYLKKLKKLGLTVEMVKQFKFDYVGNFFIANEFFDALPIKQFLKKEKKWYERHVNFVNDNELEFLDIPFNMKKFENKIKFNISYKQKFIEYSPLAAKYLKTIIKKIKLNNGGILIIDYAYLEKEMKNTLQAVSEHRYCNILKSFRGSDITYNLNFNLINKIIKTFFILILIDYTKTFSNKAWNNGKS